MVSGNYYSALGVPAVIGRTITEADDNAAATPVVVLSHRFWASRFNGDPAAIGKQVNINNVAYDCGCYSSELLGDLTSRKLARRFASLAWEPQINAKSSNLEGAGAWWLRLMGRLKPGATMAQAEASLAGPFQQSVLEHRAATDRRRNCTARLIRRIYRSSVLSPGAGVR